MTQSGPLCVGREPCAGDVVGSEDVDIDEAWEVIAEQ